MERLGKEMAFNVQKAGNWAESRILEYAIVFHLLLGLGLNSLVDLTAKRMSAILQVLCNVNLLAVRRCSFFPGPLNLSL